MDGGQAPVQGKVNKEKKTEKNFHKTKLPFETIRQHMLCEQEVTVEQ